LARQAEGTIGDGGHARHLILVKHSLPEIDPQTPAHWWLLSEAGRRRCGPLAARLAPYRPDAIVSSLEPKAMETAQLVATALGLRATTSPGLHEHDRSDVVGLSREEFQVAIAALFAHPDRVIFGRESARQAQQRFVQSVSGVLEERPNQTVVVVTHGTVISLHISQVTGCDPLALWRRLGLPSFLVMSLPGLALLEVVESVIHENAAA